MSKFRKWELKLFYIAPQLDMVQCIDTFTHIREDAAKRQEPMAALESVEMSYGLTLGGFFPMATNHKQARLEI